MKLGLGKATFSSLMGLLILSACADSKPDRTRHNVPIYEYNDENEAFEESRDWIVRCQNDSLCPDSVAQLVMVSGAMLGVCTATLIAPDMALTNSHCFDIDENVSPEALCSRGAVLVFPSNSPKGREIVECSQILYKSKIATESERNFRNPDYLVMKLKNPIDRKFEKINFQGISDGQILTIKKINPEKRGLGILEVDQCEVMYGTFLLPAATKIQSPVHAISYCHVISGNSGSGLWDQNGNLSALVFAGITDEGLNSGQLPESFIQTLKNARPAFVTNAACMGYFGNQAQHPDCSLGLSQSEQDINLFQDSINTVAREIENYEGDPRFGYKVHNRSESQGLSVTLSLRPYCFNSPVDKLTSLTQMSIPSKKWKMDAKLTSKLKIREELKRIPKSCIYQSYPRENYIEVTSSDPDCIEMLPLSDFSTSIDMSNSSLASIGVEQWTTCSQTRTHP